MDIFDLIKQNSKSVKLSGLFEKRFGVIENLFYKKSESFIVEFANRQVKFYWYLYLLVITIFIARLVNLQILGYEEFHTLSNKNFLRSEIINPNRGLILDAKGNFLVKNVPKYVLNQNLSKCLILKDKDFSSCAFELRELRKFIDFDIDLAIKSYDENKVLINLKREISKDEAILIGSLKNLKSIEISIVPLREYSYGLSMSHLVGYVGLSSDRVGIYEGKQGIEEYYNSILSGVPGQSLYKADSLNNKLEEYTQISPIPGKDIKLTIDSNLQDYGFKLLQEKISKNNSIRGGVIVVENPKTGEILSLVNYPSFDLNQMSKGISSSDYNKLISSNNSPFLNRAISSVYAPGSVFKLVTASGILEQGIAKSRDEIFDNGFIKIGDYRFNNWKLTGHGVVDITRAIKVSNDTYFYIYSGGYEDKKGLGISGISTWARKFGFGEKTGIDLFGEAKGYVPDGNGKTWYLGDTYITAIGQGDLLSSPIQVSSLMSYFANNQKAMVPHIVSEIDNLKKKEKILYQNLLTEQNFQILKNALKEVTLPGGTAYPFFDFENVYKFGTGGKTGTSEYFDSVSGKMLTHAWYSGFAPYDNPEITVTVFLESGGGGADDAAPIARKIMDFYFQKK